MQSHANSASDMSGDQPCREGQQRIHGVEDRSDVLEGLIVMAARWLQIAAIVWLGVLSHRFMVPRPIAEILYWFSWLMMAAGSFTMIAIAVRCPRLRGGLIRTMTLLWLFLAIALIL